MPDLTDPLRGVKRTLRRLKPAYNGATLVLLKKGKSSGAWERHATLGDEEGWDYNTVTDPQTRAREEILTIFESAVATSAVLNGVWSAFDIIRADGTFTRYTKISPLPLSGLSRKWKFLVRPNTEDRRPTPPIIPPP